MLVEISILVELESPVHIGSGSLGDSLADKPLIKSARGIPIIPGSSIKGKARHMAEQIIRALVTNWKWQSCNAPYPDRMCKGDDAEILCPVCRLFGTPEYQSPVRFGNLLPQLVEGLPKVKDWEHRFDAGIRSGVGLSRAQRTAQEDILYTVETWQMPAALVFRGEVRGELYEKREVALLVAALKALRTVGGSRSRGLGWCAVVPTVRLDKDEHELSELLREIAQWTN